MISSEVMKKSKYGECLWNFMINNIEENITEEKFNEYFLKFEEIAKENFKKISIKKLVNEYDIDYELLNKIAKRYELNFKLYMPIINSYEDKNIISLSHLYTFGFNDKIKTNIVFWYLNNLYFINSTNLIKINKTQLNILDNLDLNIEQKENIIINNNDRQHYLLSNNPEVIFFQ